MYAVIATKCRWFWSVSIWTLSFYVSTNATRNHAYNLHIFIKLTNCLTYFNHIPCSHGRGRYTVSQASQAYYIYQWWRIIYFVAGSWNSGTFLIIYFHILWPHNSAKSFNRFVGGSLVERPCGSLVLSGKWKLNCVLIAAGVTKGIV